MNKTMKRMNKKYLISLIGVLALGVAAVLFWRLRGGEPEFEIATTIVERGSVSNSITATGTLEATNTVEVGTQVSGVIEKLYVDFNSVVKKGQLIAELDKTTLTSTLETAEADLEKAQAKYDYQKSIYERNKGLYEKELLAQSDYDLIVYNYQTSKAELKSSKANLDKAQRNLSYATIYSPIDGVVLNRAVEEGQTVAASMSTPELYTITNDLSTMQVEADIDEADIGMLMVGQRVEFTVDAFPDLTFEGAISEIRLQPTESSNVVTYTTIVTVSNPDLKLKPGMTASINAYVEEANDVLLVKTKATSFTPDQQLLSEYLRSLIEGEEASQPEKSEAKEGQRRPGPQREMAELDDAHKVVWVKTENEIRPTVIEVGIDDGSNIEVISGLEEGAEVLTSLSLALNSKMPKNGPGEGGQKSPFVQERGKGGGGPPR